MVVSGISTLFLLRRPPTISWAIIAAVVYSVDRMEIRRSLPHVVVESNKAIAPFIANGNTASAVVFVLFVFWVAATFNYVGQRSIFRGFARSVKFANKAAATAIVATRKIAPSCDNLLSAIALTEPSLLVLMAKACELSEPLTSPINKLHFGDYLS